VKVIDAFIDQLLELIVTPNDYVRETTTELVGSTLSPATYCILLHPTCLWLLVFILFHFISSLCSP
jgi:deoxyribodipyrimidine photolyase-like uncharacterized protein